MASNDLSRDFWWWLVLGLSGFFMLVLVFILFGRWCYVYHPCNSEYYTEQLVEEARAARREKRRKLRREYERDPIKYAKELQVLDEYEARWRERRQQQQQQQQQEADEDGAAAQEVQMLSAEAGAEAKAASDIRGSSPSTSDDSHPRNPFALNAYESGGLWMRELQPVRATTRGGDGSVVRREACTPVQKTLPLPSQPARRERSPARVGGGADRPGASDASQHEERGGTPRPAVRRSVSGRREGSLTASPSSTPPPAAGAGGPGAPVSALVQQSKLASPGRSYLGSTDSAVRERTIGSAAAADDAAGAAVNTSSAFRRHGSLSSNSAILGGSQVKGRTRSNSHVTFLDALHGESDQNSFMVPRVAAAEAPSTSTGAREGDLAAAPPVVREPFDSIPRRDQAAPPSDSGASGTGTRPSAAASAESFAGDPAGRGVAAAVQASIESKPLRVIQQARRTPVALALPSSVISSSMAGGGGGGERRQPGQGAPRPAAAAAAAAPPPRETSEERGYYAFASPAAAYGRSSSLTNSVDGQSATVEFIADPLGASSGAPSSRASPAQASDGVHLSTSLPLRSTGSTALPTPDTALSRSPPDSMHAPHPGDTTTPQVVDARGLSAGQAAAAAAAAVAAAATGDSRSAHTTAGTRLSYNASRSARRGVPTGVGKDAAHRTGHSQQAGGSAPVARVTPSPVRTSPPSNMDVLYEGDDNVSEAETEAAQPLVYDAARVAFPGQRSPSPRGRATSAGAAGERHHTAAAAVNSASQRRNSSPVPAPAPVPASYGRPAVDASVASSLSMPPPVSARARTRSPPALLASTSASMNGPVPVQGALQPAHVSQVPLRAESMSTSAATYGAPPQPAGVQHRGRSDSGIRILRITRDPRAAQDDVPPLQTLGAGADSLSARGGPEASFQALGAPPALSAPAPLQHSRVLPEATGPGVAGVYPRATAGHSLPPPTADPYWRGGPNYYAHASVQGASAGQPTDRHSTGSSSRTTGTSPSHTPRGPSAQAPARTHDGGPSRVLSPPPPPGTDYYGRPGGAGPL